MIKIAEIYELRNQEIVNLFKAGWRQKEIAERYELSESRVKKIVGQNRKNVAKRWMDDAQMPLKLNLDGVD